MKKDTTFMSSGERRGSNSSSTQKVKVEKLESRKGKKKLRVSRFTLESPDFTNKPGSDVLNSPLLEPIRMKKLKKSSNHLKKTLEPKQ
jgi:hypothetical protein